MNVLYVWANMNFQIILQNSLAIKDIIFIHNVSKIGSILVLVKILVLYVNKKFILNQKTKSNNKEKKSKSNQMVNNSKSKKEKEKDYYENIRNKLQFF